MHHEQLQRVAFRKLLELYTLIDPTSDLDYTAAQTDWSSRAFLDQAVT